MNAKVEIITSRKVPLGGLRAMTVNRTLPQRQRSFVGAWCFIDHYGPDDVSITGGMDVAPHPHTGLQTVSWLFEGEIAHHDSAGNHAVVKPGEVNLMTAGRGICHSEVSTTTTRVLHGVQLWVALPKQYRSVPRGFESYAVAATEFCAGTARVFIGSLLGVTSPVKTYTPLLGAEINLNPGMSFTCKVNPEFEHGVLLDTGEVRLEGTVLGRTNLGYTGRGEHTLTMENTGETPARMILLGGVPFAEEIVMWWNFIGSSSEEIGRFRAEWESATERFGEVHGYIGHTPHALSRIPAPDMPIVKLKPRFNPTPVARPDERI